MADRSAQVFISYQRADEPFARRVREHLAAANVRTWMDQYDIPVGAYWPDEIDRGLSSSDIVIGVLSADAVASRNVKNEWDWAIQNDKPLLLLQYRPCVVPHRYVSINYIDATAADVVGALDTLLATLGIAGTSPETATDATATPTHPTPQRHRSRSTTQPKRVAPLVIGREREQAQLRELLDAMLAGQGSVVLLAGEAGIGKTTLTSWLAAEAEDRGALVVSGGCSDTSAWRRRRSTPSRRRATSNRRSGGWRPSRRIDAIGRLSTGWAGSKTPSQAATGDRRECSNNLCGETTPAKGGRVARHIPFRFGVSTFRFGTSTSGTEHATMWREIGRRAEALGYATLTVADHFSGCFAWSAALTAIADVTSSLRLGTLVLDNDFRHPAAVAMEAATVDLLSGGRLELGLGAGWLKDDYDRIGLPFEAPGVRASRLEDSVRIIKALLAGESVSVNSTHYQLADHTLFPAPVQQPRLPILIGAGGKRLLTFAAREADTIALAPRALPGGGLDLGQAAPEAWDEKVAWVREAAGARFDELELNILLQRVVVTDDQQAAIEAVSDAWRQPVEALRHSPLLLIGSVEQMVDALQERRERFGISYIVVFEPAMEAFAPVVARLAGT